MHEVSLGHTLRDYLTGRDVDHTTYEDLRQALARMLVEELGHPRHLVEPRVRVRFDTPADGPGTGQAPVDVAARASAGPQALGGALAPGAALAPDAAPDRAAPPSLSPSVAGPADSGDPAGPADSADADDGCRVVDLALRGDDGAPLCIVLFCPGAPGTYMREGIAAARLFPGGPAPLLAVTDTRDALLVASADGAVLGAGMQALPRRDRLLLLAAQHPCPPLPPERAAAERRILGAYTAFLKKCCGEDVCLL